MKKSFTSDLDRLCGLFVGLSFVSFLAFVGVGLSFVPGVPASAGLLRAESFAGFGCLFFFAAAVCVGLVMPEE